MTDREGGPMSWLRLAAKFCHCGSLWIGMKPSDGAFDGCTLKPERGHDPRARLQKECDELHRHGTTTGP
eukprot:CAMPEP_0119348162 /NCGR_PEP_ID=MMETSP1333-20130426/108899_1 /TAXON_ID=418940 /ORGANISM="Scyphosphaera apsteinii, Strain RCC1455" /LENGTH=68 /DNA_ID=CAMNT_0007360731 /DNA_START=952 /DNA_END=1155 /DNA_ORIENTATION=+